MADVKLSKPLEEDLRRLYKAWGPQEADKPTFAIWAATRQSWLADFRKFARMVEEVTLASVPEKKDDWLYGE